MIILFGFLGQLVNSEPEELKESNYVTLECPFGWRVQGQAWYVPINSTGSWQNGTKAIDRGSFKSKDVKAHMMCAICESDLTKVQSDSAKNRLEICLHDKYQQGSQQKLEFETQNCSFVKNLNWCKSPHYLCALNVPTSGRFLKQAIGSTSAFSCSDVHERIAKNENNRNSNPFKDISMICPTGSTLTGFEKRRIQCVLSKESFCILCASTSAEFSVCLSSCANLWPGAQINGLVVKSSTTPYSGRCGITINAEEAENFTKDDLASLNLSKENFISCQKLLSPESQEVTQSDFNIFIAVVAILSVIIVGLVGAVILQRFKIKRLESGERKEACDTRDRLSQVNTDDNLEMDPNPYYE